MSESQILDSELFGLHYGNLILPCLDYVVPYIFSLLKEKETLYFDNAETHNRDILSLFKRKYHSCIKILNLKLLHSF